MIWIVGLVALALAAFLWGFREGEKEGYSQGFSEATLAELDARQQRAEQVTGQLDKIVNIYARGRQ